MQKTFNTTITNRVIDIATNKTYTADERAIKQGKVLDELRGHVAEGGVEMYVALALLTASDDWSTCEIVRPEEFETIFTEGMRRGALAPKVDNPAWDWMDVAIEYNDPEDFTDEMELYYDVLATAMENGVWLARDIIDMIWEPEQCIEED